MHASSPSSLDCIFNPPLPSPLVSHELSFLLYTQNVYLLPRRLRSGVRHVDARHVHLRERRWLWHDRRIRLIQRPFRHWAVSAPAQVSPACLRSLCCARVTDSRAKIAKRPSRSSRAWGGGGRACG
eukprot:3023939-Pleurochrysis_carterae.AAC.2